ncbi:helix-turn-helix transcriptional regulator [Microbacterium plantarum]|uniref:helix-turn-helix transcriptional regulator n=1 Tax=Microbacterium plantarum TaxID=1816425 RepID=UPI002B4A0BBC|nr:helix-turn-helix transcriptional regulator [Microbacterium plantarum]WRK17752.1 helix-turn-helix transcriptional regulator [Microbacterium plantarum]
MSDNKSVLGSFLRARRSRVRPTDVGLRPTDGRRVSGLKRDEVAMLAGISIEYYTRLEQGRGADPSTTVVRALARALNLDDVSVEYVNRLTGRVDEQRRMIPPEKSYIMRELLDTWAHIPAYITNGNLDIVAVNELMHSLSSGTIRPGANALVAHFAAGNKRQIVNWEELAARGVATLRFLGDRTSTRYDEIVRELSRDQGFVRLWELHEVARPSDFDSHLRLDGIGEIQMRVHNFEVPSLPFHTLTTQSPKPGFTALADTPVSRETSFA